MRYFLATLSLCALMVTPVLAEGSAEAGAKVFKKCAACHAVGEGAKNKVGPELNAIFGRKVAGVESFNYSPAFKTKAQGRMGLGREAPDGIPRQSQGVHQGHQDGLRRVEEA